MIWSLRNGDRDNLLKSTSSRDHLLPIFFVCRVFAFTIIRNLQQVWRTILFNTHTRSLSFSLSLSHTHTLSLSLSHIHTHKHIHSVYYTHAQAHTHLHNKHNVFATHTPALSLLDTRFLSLSLSVCLSLSLSFFFSLSLSFKLYPLWPGALRSICIDERIERRKEIESKIIVFVSVISFTLQMKVLFDQSTMNIDSWKVKFPFKKSFCFCEKDVTKIKIVPSKEWFLFSQCDVIYFIREGHMNIQ